MPAAGRRGLAPEAVPAVAVGEAQDLGPPDENNNVHMCQMIYVHIIYIYIYIYMCYVYV